MNNTFCALEVANFKAGCFDHRGLYSQQRHRGETSWFDLLNVLVQCSSVFIHELQNLNPVSTIVCSLHWRRKQIVSMEAIEAWRKFFISL